MHENKNEKALKIVAAFCLGLGGLLGLAGSFAPTDTLRGLAWGIDGISLVIATSILVIHFYRKGEDIMASGFLVFTIGQGLIVSGAAMSLTESSPFFGAGAGLWAAALTIVSLPRIFPFIVRCLGILTALLFTITAVQIFMGFSIHPKSQPLPFYAYPAFVATIFGWIWALIKREHSDE